MNLMPWRNKQPEGGRGELSPAAAFRTEMDRLFDSFFREPLGAMDWPLWGPSKWAPAIDVAETEKDLIITAEVPGIDPKDLEVTVVGNEVVLSGEKRESTEREGKNFQHTETRYGSFRRTIPLPDGIDTENVDAKYANGVLTLTLQKTPELTGKRIEVKVS